MVMRFENEFKPSEISFLRAAIANKIGKDNILFHHHNDEKTLLFRYPLIQYKLTGNKMLIVCLCEATEEMQKFLELKNWDIHIKRKKITLKIDKINMHRFNLQVWDKQFFYRIGNWLPLNKDNYGRYFSTVSLTERIRLLEKTLTAHILAFAEGVKWNVEKEIIVTLHNIHKEQWLEYRGIRFFSPQLTFSANVSLPDYIGLGKAVSVGFGMVKRIHLKKSHETVLTNIENEPAER